MTCRTRLLVVAPLLAGLALAPAAYAQQHHDYHGNYRGGQSGHYHGDYRGGGSGNYHGNPGAAIIGGIIGLGLGAAIAGASQPPPPAYYYAPPPVYYTPPPVYYTPPPPAVYYGAPY